MGLAEICFRDNIFGIISMFLCNKSNKARGEEIGWQEKEKKKEKEEMSLAG